MASPVPCNTCSVLFFVFRHGPSCWRIPYVLVGRPRIAAQTAATVWGTASPALTRLSRHSPATNGTNRPQQHMEDVCPKTALTHMVYSKTDRKKRIEKRTARVQTTMIALTGLRTQALLEESSERPRNVKPQPSQPIACHCSSLVVFAQNRSSFGPDLKL